MAARKSKPRKTNTNCLVCGHPEKAHDDSPKSFCQHFDSKTNEECDCPAYVAPGMKKPKVKPMTAVEQLDTRAHETWVRLEAQADYHDPEGSSAFVRKFEFDEVAGQVEDLRYLVSHLIMVLRRHRINPFRHSRGVKR